MINGHNTPDTALQQAGLPQGSPLSPILFLFFNADLVQRRIDRNGGAIAFVDDYTVWVTGTSAASNRQRIQGIVDEATKWERRSGATFEQDKTAFIHFTRNRSYTDEQPILVKGKEIKPALNTKILGIIMDSELRYKQQVARAATKGLKAAMALKRLKGLSPAIARRLFETAVTPVIDYASNVWMYASSIDRNALERTQKIGAQAVTGCFRTTATAIAEAEACIRTVQERHTTKAAQMLIGLHTLPQTNPLTRLNTEGSKRFISPLQKTANAHRDVAINRLEVIEPYVLTPWEPRLRTSRYTDKTRMLVTTSQTKGFCITTSSSLRNGLVGVGGTIEDTSCSWYNGERMTFSITLGPRTEHNPYTANLTAISEALWRLAPLPRDRTINIISSDQGALQSISKPKHQSGQAIIKQIYKEVQKLRKLGNYIRLEWASTSQNSELRQQAKIAARKATEEYCLPRLIVAVAKSTMVSIQKQNKGQRVLRTKAGQHLQRIDTALPGPHIRRIYDSLTRRQADILVQLRTGMARLNGYLYQIRAVEKSECVCGQTRETVEHFLLYCKEWEAQREQLYQQLKKRNNTLSYLLGGKSLQDDKDWKPDMEAIHTTIKFVLATGRLDK
jgi:ribonuclease HI